MRARIWVVLADVLFLFLGSAQAWLSLRLPNGLGLSAAEPGPGLFPMLVGVLMCIAASLHLMQNLRAKFEEGQISEGSNLAIGLLILAIAGYILLLPRAGFAVSACILLLCTLTIYGMPNFLNRLGTALLGTAMAYLLFTKVLGVNMPAAAWL